MLLCLTGCLVVAACILVFFSVQRRIMLDDLNSWSAQRQALIYLQGGMPADQVFDLMQKQPGLNGYILYLDVQQDSQTNEELELHGVWGSVSERLTPETAMAGPLEGTDEDVFILRHANYVPGEYLFHADEMPLEIDGIPFSCGGVQNGTWSLPYDRLIPTGRAVTIRRPGSATVLDPDELFSSVIIVPAACAARHAWPVAALRVCYAEPDARPQFFRLLDQLGDAVARYEMPWAESEAAPSLREIPFGMVTKLLPVLIAMITMMTLLYFWLGSFRFALRAWQRQGAGRGPCRRGLFWLGMTLLAASALLGYGVYRLVLLWGGHSGLMLALPGSVVSLLLVLYGAVCLLCLEGYCARAARINLEKGGLRE